MDKLFKSKFFLIITSLVLFQTNLFASEPKKEEPASNAQAIANATLAKKSQPKKKGKNKKKKKKTEKAEQTTSKADSKPKAENKDANPEQQTIIKPQEKSISTETKIEAEKQKKLDAKQVAELFEHPEKYPEFATAYKSMYPVIAVSKDGNFVAFEMNKKIAIKDMIKNKIVAKIPLFKIGHFPICLAFHPQNSNIIAVGYSGSPKFLGLNPQSMFLILYDWKKEILKHLGGHTDWVTAITFNHDGSRLASTSDDQSVLIWDTCDFAKATLEICLDNAHENYGQSVSFNADDTLLVSGGFDGNINVYNLKKKQFIYKQEKMNTNASCADMPQHKHHHDPAVAVFHPKNPYLLAVATTNNTIRLIDVSIKKDKTKPHCVCDIAHLDFIKDNDKRLYAVPYITHLAFNNSGTKLACRTNQGSLYNLNIADREVVSCTAFKVGKYYDVYSDIAFCNEDVLCAGFRYKIKTNAKNEDAFMLRWNTNANQG